MTEIDKYIKRLAASDQKTLLRIREIIIATIPGAEEVMSYGMPGFKLNGKYLFGYGAFKDHCSIFPTSEPIEKLANSLKEYNTSKGTIQLKSDREFPETLIQKLVKIRQKSILGM